jgi:hypothetical protein
MPTKRRQLDIIRGARGLAAYVFGDENEWRRIYALKDELGLFRLGGEICGRPETIAARVAARETTAQANAAE